MLYRRFGRTELQMPVITIGGMRFQSSWKADQTDSITAQQQSNLEECIRSGLDHGM